MWILPKQLLTSHFVQDTEASTLDLEAFCQGCEHALMWRSKPSQSRTWFQRCKRIGWMQLLSGATLKPSTHDHFVEKWTSSLEDSHANHSVTQGNEKVQTNLDICSQILNESSWSVSQESSFSKMSKGLFMPSTEELNNRFSTMSLEDWNLWVTEQRQVYLARKNASIRTGVRESSSQGWPTPRTSDTVGGQQELDERGQRVSATTGLRYGAKLSTFVNWATPQVTDSTRDNQIRKPEDLTDAAKKGGCKNLREDVQKWATPSTMETIKQEGLHSFNGKYYMKPTKKTSIQTLFGIEDVSKNQKHQTDLGLQVEVYSQATPQNPNNLGKPQEQSVTRKLSPLWVAQLMGLPMANWCVINVSIHCAPLETE